ncbi:MAG: hypothetical protein F6K17_11045 [Okeania sp. SIO3C4]|nr:hypothetical protein [Okeania sp. SIO3B3]NER03121.1 hypothetical protein [Okeania sp. SIO3C4]
MSSFMLRKMFIKHSDDAGGGRRKKWMGTKTPTSCKHPVDGGVLNPKEKDKNLVGLIKKLLKNCKHSAVSYQPSAIAFSFR